MGFQARLSTKLDHLSVNDPVVELQNSADPNKLNKTIHLLLEQIQNIDKSDYEGKTFKFILGGRLLLTSVEKHLELYSGDVNVDEILSENVVEIEYLLEIEPPEPQDDVSHDDWVSCIDANEEYIVTGSYDCSIRILSIKDRKNLLTIPEAHQKPITSIKICSHLASENDPECSFYVISSAHDEVSILWRIYRSNKKHEFVPTLLFRGHNRSINCSDIYDNLLVTGSFDKTIKIWTCDIKNNDEQPVVDISKKRKTKSNEKSISRASVNADMTLTGHSESITGVKWLKGCYDFNSIASCSLDNSVQVWDIEVGECKSKFLSSKPLLGLDYSKQNNLIIAASCDKHIRAWDSRAPNTATARSLYTSHSAWVSKVVFSSKDPNHFVSGGYDNLVKLWDIRSPKACLFDLIGHHNKVLDVNFSNPAYVLSGSADSTLKVFRTKN